MTRDEYKNNDAVSLKTLIDTGQVTSLDLVELAIAEIEAQDAQLGALVSVDVEGARQAAVQPKGGALAGLPVLIKDTNIDVRGFPTRHGSRLYKDVPAATRDSEFVRRLREAGAVVLGKTKTPEFAGDFVTEPEYFGPCRNPRNPRYASGGSSGGSACAVAAGMVPIAHGTDCGGSIRVPAAVCGVVGLKPTRGRNPVGPHVGEFVGGLDCEHVLTRTVRDTALMLDVLAGFEAGSPYAAPPGPASWLESLKSRSAPLKIAFSCARPDGTDIDDAIARAVLGVVDLLGSDGHRLQDFTWPDITGAGDAAAVFWQLEIEALMSQRALDLGRPLHKTDVEWVTYAMYEASKARSALDVYNARQVQNRVSRTMAALFNDIDVLITPTVALPPPLIGGFTAAKAQELQVWYDNAYAFSPFTEVFNLTGQPAISVPIGIMQDGLPIGLQLVGRFGDEETILRLASEIESSFTLKR
ncbi:amidase [Pseudomonas plecoglossicida]|uniref:amidase n=1 Tax=Pseudomonas plecoglossicida TaxID=70775 RepID=UPI0004912488|nr:amidase [Pseudomonas plecoglossicida]GLR35095.1 amidase [Pseudomonas plecoglossicida]